MIFLSPFFFLLDDSWLELAGWDAAEASAAG